MRYPCLTLCSIVALSFFTSGCVHQPDRLATGKNTGARPLDEVVGEAADNALKNNNYAEAVGYLALLHHQNPQDRDIAVRYATALRRTGKTDEALAVLKDFTQPEDGSASALTERARTLLQANRPADALQNARWAVDSDPKNGDAYDVLGVALDSLNKPDEAEKAFQTALANQTSTPEHVMNNLGMSYARRGNLVDAIKTLEQASRLSNQSPLILANLDMVRNLQEQKKMFVANQHAMPSYTPDLPPVPAISPIQMNPGMIAAYPAQLHAEQQQNDDVILLPVSNSPDFQAQIIDQTINIMVPAGVVVDIQELAHTLQRHVDDIQMVADKQASRIVMTLNNKANATSQKVNGRWIVTISERNDKAIQQSSLAQPVIPVATE